MTYQEVNTIIQACMRYRIMNTCRKEGNLYVINLMVELDFRSFEAAKLAVNSMVLENRNKPKPKDPPATLDLSGLNFSGYGIKKKKEYEPGKWAENRMKDYCVLSSLMNVNSFSSPYWSMYSFIVLI